MKYGCDINDEKIPETIRRGIDTKAPGLIERRKDWNTPAADKFALPTEIWRETMARRKRYFELKAKIENGEVHDIDDLITYNLDIERFAADVLGYYEGSDFIAAFYEAIAGKKVLRSHHQAKRGITVLDPACGSGAFLFASLNILEPLYGKCIERMRDFVDEDDGLRKQGKRKGTKKHPHFRSILKDITSHQNEKYWIYKTIILNNLYGVDLMKEAAEIAKLRLFLKLAAEAEYDPRKNNLGLDPLPDIDFNIRSGNSLVGFVSMAAFEKSVSINTSGQTLLDLSDGLIDAIREEAGLVQKANDAFRQAQDVGGENYQQEKSQLGGYLAGLNDKMNHYLAREYGKDDKKADYEQWLESHQPFHWLAEFYGIIEQSGGFDVVIGNPPYVKYSKVKKDYTVKDYKTEACGNLYALFVEIGMSIVKKRSYLGMITPISLMSAKAMQNLRVICSSHRVYASSFADRPNALFVGVHQMLSIMIVSPEIGESYFSSGFIHWRKEERSNLFFRFAYTHNQFRKNGVWPKIGSTLEKSILEKIGNHKTPLTSYFRKSGKLVSICGGTGGYWLRTFDEKVSSNEYKQYFTDDKYLLYLCATMNSSLFYWFWRKCSNSRHLNKKDMEKFTFDLNSPLNTIEQASKTHLVALKATKEHRAGGMSYDQYRPARVKGEVDVIDTLLAPYYCLTEEELDYIINYDIKYRMGLGK